MANRKRFSQRARGRKTQLEVLSQLARASRHVTRRRVVRLCCWCASAYVWNKAGVKIRISRTPRENPGDVVAAARGRLSGVRGPNVVNPGNGPDANDPDDGAPLNGNGAKSGARTRSLSEHDASCISISLFFLEFFMRPRVGNDRSCNRFSASNIPMFFFRPPSSSSTTFQIYATLTGHSSGLPWLWSTKCHETSQVVDLHRLSPRIALCVCVFSPHLHYWRDVKVAICAIQPDWLLYIRRKCVSSIKRRQVFYFGNSPHGEVMVVTELL